MWLTLIVMLLSYLMQPRNTAAERRRALVGSLAAGAVTYGVTEYTDWGQQNLAPIDKAIGDFVLPEKSTVGASGTGGGTGTLGTATSSLAGVVKAATPLLAVGAGVSLLKDNKWLLPALLAGGVYFLSQAGGGNRPATIVLQGPNGALQKKNEGVI